MEVILKLFKRSPNRFHNLLFRLARFHYSHAALQIGSFDYYLHVNGLIKAPPEIADYQQTFDINEKRYQYWQSTFPAPKRKFHKIRYLLSPWFRYNNCISFASSLVIWHAIFYNPNDLCKEIGVL